MKERRKSFRAPARPNLTPDQVANILAVRVDTVTRHFANVEGVLDLGTPETMHQRRKRYPRTPRTPLERDIRDRQTHLRRPN